MAAIRMWIDKFGSEVLIQDDHPLAVAQRAKNAAAPADTPLASAPAAPAAPATPFAVLSSSTRPRPKRNAT